MKRLVPGGDKDTGISSDEENEKIPVNQNVAYTEDGGNDVQMTSRSPITKKRKTEDIKISHVYKEKAIENNKILPVGYAEWLKHFITAIWEGGILPVGYTEWLKYFIKAIWEGGNTDEDNKIANNIMSNLFNRDLDGPLQKIFLYLDPLSLKAGRQVCKQWDDFIKRRVWGSKSGSLPYKSLRRKLDYHWRHANPNARTASVGGHIYSMSCDNSVIVCGMFYALVKVFDVATLGLLTVLDTRADDDGIREDWVNVEVDIGKEVICAVTYGGGMCVWRRSGWSLLYKQRVDVSLHAVMVINNYIITSGCYNFHSNQLAVFKYDGQQVTPMAKLAKSEDVAVCENGNIDSDGVWILAGTGTRLTLWKLESYKEVKSCYTSNSIGDVSLLYPFGLTVGGAKGITMWDLEKGEIMRNFGNGNYGQVHNNGKFFWWLPIGLADPEEKSMLLYNIEEMINAKVPSEKLWNRRMNFISSSKYVHFALNTSCLFTERKKKVCVWDFWNCDQFKDESDDFEANPEPTL